MPTLEPVVEQAVRQFTSMISDRYAVKQIIVYGSRARGDHRPDSDVDVAVILYGEKQRCLPVQRDMSKSAFDVLLETGILISPLPIWLEEWERPSEYSNPLLLMNIDKDGVRV